MSTKESILSYMASLKKALMAKNEMYTFNEDYLQARKDLLHLKQNIVHTINLEDPELLGSVTSSVSMLGDYVEQAEYWQIARKNQESIDKLVAFEQSRTSVRVDLGTIHEQYKRPQERKRTSTLEVLVDVCKTANSERAYRNLVSYLVTNSEQMDFSEYVHAREAAEDLFKKGGAAQYAVDQGIITWEQHDYIEKRAELCLKKNHFRLLAEKKQKELLYAQNFYSASEEDTSDKRSAVQKRGPVQAVARSGAEEPERQDYAANAPNRSWASRDYSAAYARVSGFLTRNLAPSPHPARQ